MLEEIKDERASKILKKVACLTILDILVFIMSNQFGYNHYLPIYTGFRVGWILLVFVGTMIELLKWMFKIVKHQAKLLSDDVDFIDESEYSDNLEKYKIMLMLACEIGIVFMIINPLLRDYREMVFRDFIFINALVNLILYQMLLDIMRIHIYSKIKPTETSKV